MSRLAFTSKTGTVAQHDSSTVLLTQGEEGQGEEGKQVFTFTRPPYHRFPLTGDTPPLVPLRNRPTIASGTNIVSVTTDSPPNNHGDATQLQEHWNKLWHTLRSVGPREHRSGSFYACYGMLLLLVLFGSVFIVVRDNEWGGDLAEEVTHVLGMVGTALWMLLCWDFGRALYSHYSRRRRYLVWVDCRHGPELALLRRHGWGVEYQPDHTTGSPDSLFLFVIPVAACNTDSSMDSCSDDSQDDNESLRRFVEHNGFVRIELCKSRAHISSHIPSLPPVHGFEVLHDDPDAVWSKFWTQLCRDAQTNRHRMRLITVVLWVFPLLMTVLLTAILWQQAVLTALALVGVVGLVVGVCLGSRAISKGTRTEYQDDVSRRGFYWETRTTLVYSKWGAREAVYFYLFPSPKSPELC